MPAMTAPAAAGGVGSATGGTSYYGKYAGQVLQNTKPQNANQHPGELLVEVPGILEEDPSGTGSRALQVIAKPSFAPGFFFIPEPNTPVWVEFVAGDVNQAIWTGIWRAPGTTV